MTPSTEVQVELLSRKVKFFEDIIQELIRVMNLKGKVSDTSYQLTLEDLQKELDTEKLRSLDHAKTFESQEKNKET